ncbi:hypothetical protein NC651_029686 [Populus alba x Populus x berolinensis]|nr:hypothetical protein NC651_029686 [Populus alba x Populus x berolinensis]
MLCFAETLDAQAALKYALGNKSLFGDVNVRYNIREVGAPASEAPESDKSRDDTSVDAAQAEDPLADWQAVAFAHQPPSQSTVQQKSILKRPNGDEAAPVTGGNGSRGNRVKFMLGGEETNSGEQMMVGNRNNFNNMLVLLMVMHPLLLLLWVLVVRTFKRFFPPPPLPILPLPTQFAKAPLNYSQPSYRSSTQKLAQFQHPPPPSAGPSTPTIDISQQMLRPFDHLQRCYVTSVSGLVRAMCLTTLFDKPLWANTQNPHRRLDCLNWDKKASHLLQGCCSWVCTVLRLGHNQCWLAKTFLVKRQQQLIQTQGHGVFLAGRQCQSSKSIMIKFGVKL